MFSPQSCHKIYFIDGFKRKVTSANEFVLSSITTVSSLGACRSLGQLFRTGILLLGRGGICINLCIRVEDDLVADAGDEFEGVAAGVLRGTVHHWVQQS